MDVSPTLAPPQIRSRGADHSRRCSHVLIFAMGAWIRCRCAAATPAFDRLPCGVQCTVFHQTTPHFYRTTFLYMSSSWLFFALACLLAMHAESMSKDCTSTGTQVHVYFQQSGVILPDEAKDSLRVAVAKVASLRAWDLPAPSPRILHATPPMSRLRPR